MAWRRVAFMALILTQTLLLVGSVDRFEGATGYLHVEDRTIPVHYLPPREYERAWDRYPELTSNVWYASFTRGFTADGQIYVREGPILDERQLLAHEVGHILGYDHTVAPTTMNAWGVFRLVDAEGLEAHVREGYEPPGDRHAPEPPAEPISQEH